MAQYKNIDIVPDETITRVHLSQGDIGRTLIFYLFENALSWSVPASSTIKCQGTKPSGFGFSVSCTYSGNAVTCVTTEEMTDEYGQIEAELVITSPDESQIFGTSNFILDIERNPHPDGTVDGDAENPVIANLNAVITQAVDDWLDEHPEATTTVVDGSLTEAKFSEALKLATIKDYVTPEMFGAKGDGETDDTDAINLCFASHQAVKFPASKTYKIESTILIADVTSLDIDFNNCIIYSDAEQAILIYNANRVSLKNLYLDCNGNKGIKFGYRNSTDRSGNTLLKDVQIYNAIEGFRFDGTGGYNFFVRCKCNSMSSNSVGFVIGENKDASDSIGANYLYFDSCTFEGGSTGTGKCAMRLYHAIHVHVNNCDFCNITNGNAVELLCTASSYAISFVDNSFFNNEINIYVNAGSNGLLSFDVKGNHFFFGNVSQRAIVMTSTMGYIAGGVAIVDNTFVGVAVTSLVSLRATNQLIFKNNLIGDNRLRPLADKCSITVAIDNLDVNLPMSKRVSSNSTTAITATFNIANCPITPKFRVTSSNNETYSVSQSTSNGVVTFTITPSTSTFTYYYIEAYIG